jgi:hypothetical protein
MIYERNVSSIQCRMNLDRPSSVGEIDGSSLTFIDFMFQRSHNESLELRPRYIFLRTQSVVCVHIYMWTHTVCDNIYIPTLLGRGQDGPLWHPCLYYPRRERFAFNRNSEFSIGKG